MLNATIEKSPASGAQNAHQRRQFDALRAENGRLRAENRRLRAALDAYVNRARSTAMYGPLEMTAGTCIGPRRRSSEKGEPSDRR